MCNLLLFLCKVHLTVSPYAPLLPVANEMNSTTPFAENVWGAVTDKFLLSPQSFEWVRRIIFFCQLRTVFSGLFGFTLTDVPFRTKRISLNTLFSSKVQGFGIRLYFYVICPGPDVWPNICTCRVASNLAWPIRRHCSGGRLTFSRALQLLHKYTQKRHTAIACRSP